MTNADGTTGDEPRLGGQGENGREPALSLASYFSTFLLAGEHPEIRTRKLEELAGSSNPEAFRGATPEVMKSFLEVLPAHIQEYPETTQWASSVVASIGLTRSEPVVQLALGMMLSQENTELLDHVLSTFTVQLNEPDFRQHEQQMLVSLANVGRASKNEAPRARILQWLVNNIELHASADTDAWIHAVRVTAQEASIEARVVAIQTIFDQLVEIRRPRRSLRRGGRPPAPWLKPLREEVAKIQLAIAGDQAKNSHIWEALSPTAKSAVEKQEKKEAQK